MLAPLPDVARWIPGSASSLGVDSGTYSRQRTLQPTCRLLTALGVGRLREKISICECEASVPPATCRGEGRAAEGEGGGGEGSGPNVKLRYCTESVFSILNTDTVFCWSGGASVWPATCPAITCFNSLLHSTSQILMQRIYTDYPSCPAPIFF